MEWNHSTTIGMSKTGCTHCGGMGTRKVYKTKQEPCNCVMRAIFRAVFSRFKDRVAQQGISGTVSYQTFGSGKDSRRSYTRKTEDFIADFCLVSKRTLDPWEYKVFSFHFLLGADWKLCARRMGVDRGNFFHAVYRIEAKLGRAFATLEPYALYPLDEYFGNVIQNTAPAPIAPPPTARALRAPLRTFPAPMAVTGIVGDIARVA